MDGNAKQDGTLQREQPTDASPAAAAPQRVIRTYATDFAKLSGSTPPDLTPVPSTKPPIVAAPPPPPPAPAPSLAEAVSRIDVPAEAAEPHLPPVSKDEMYVRRAAPRTLDPMEGVMDTPPAPAPVVQESGPSLLSQMSDWLTPKQGAVQEVLPPMPAPAQEPIYVPPTPQPGAEPAEESREQILARLKAKVGVSQAQNIPPAPVFPTPMPETFEQTKRAAWPEAPTNLPGIPAAPAEPERLRTYTGDFSNRIDTQKASAFSVLAAQSDAQRSAPAPKPKTSGSAFMFTIIGAVLLIGGSLIVYYTYQQFATNEPVPIVDVLPTTVVSGDESFILTGSDVELMGALIQKTAEPVTIGSVRIGYLSVSTTTSTGVSQMTLPGGYLIKALKIPAPDILLRNIAPESSIGIVHAGEETRPFFILGTNSYERTFAGMLSWEATMGKDLAPLYPPYPEEELVVIAETATSTPATSTPPRSVTLIHPGFYDEVVESHDVRVLKDEKGRTVLLYGYRDQNTLIIARDETAFAVLLARLSAS